MTDEAPKQRYTYFFIDRASQKIKYATVAYSFTQAVKQIQEKHPNAPIKDYVDNHGFDYDRKPYVPKPEPVEEPKQAQMSFKDFDKKVWPNV